MKFSVNVFIFIFTVGSLGILQARPIRPFEAGPGTVEEIFGPYYETNTWSQILLGQRPSSESNFHNYHAIIFIEPINRTTWDKLKNPHQCAVRVYLEDGSYREVLLIEDTQGEFGNPRGPTIENQREALVDLAASTQHFEFGRVHKTLGDYFHNIKTGKITEKQALATMMALGVVSYGTSVYLATIWDPVYNAAKTEIELVAGEFQKYISTIDSLNIRKEQTRATLERKIAVLKTEIEHTHGRAPAEHYAGVRDGLINQLNSLIDRLRDLNKEFAEQIRPIADRLNAMKSQLADRFGLKNLAGARELASVKLPRSTLVKRLLTTTASLKTPRGAAIGAARGFSYLTLLYVGYEVTQIWSDDNYYVGHLDELFYMPKEGAEKVLAKSPLTEKTLHRMWWALNRTDALDILTDDAVASEYAQAALDEMFPDAGEDA